MGGGDLILYDDALREETIDGLSVASDGAQNYNRPTPPNTYSVSPTCVLFAMFQSHAPPPNGGQYAREILKMGGPRSRLVSMASNRGRDRKMTT